MDQASSPRAILAQQLRVRLAERPVLLERIARGAGATRWFRVVREPDIDLVVDALAPGSSVSAFFDDRLAVEPYSVEVHRLVRLLSVAVREDIVVGVFSGEGVEADVNFPSTGDEVDELFEGVSEGTNVLFGEFPARDNGAYAVSIIIEDADGVVRGHPY